MEQVDQSTPTASEVETPAAEGVSVSSGPFPWETAGFGGSAPTTVPTAEAPGGHPTSEPAKATDAVTPAPDPKTDTPAEGTPAAEPSKPDADPVEAPKPDAPPETPEQAQGRRAAARERDEAEKAELRAEVERVIAERDAAKALADKAAADKAEAEANRVASLAKRTELRGPDDEFNRRTRIANRMFDPNYDGPKLDQEQAAELARWTYTRELEEPFEIAAQESAAAWVDQTISKQRSIWADQALTVADEIGLPRAELREPNLGNLLKVTASVTAERIRAAEVAPLKEQISQLEGTIKGLEAKAVHAQRTPVAGGRSDGSLTQTNGQGWDPSLPWDGNFARTPASAGAA